MWASFRSWIRSLIGRARLEGELGDELEFHLASRTDHWIRQGLSPDEARRRARLEFGGVERHKEQWRQARGLRIVDEIRGDLIYGWRMLRTSPAFATISAATLIIAIGANVAVFNVIEAVVLRKLPVDRPDELREIAWVQSAQSRVSMSYDGSMRPWPGGDRIATSFAYLPYASVRDRATTLSDVLLFTRYDLTGAVEGREQRMIGLLVSGNFLRGLGVRPIAGRGIEPADDRAGAPPVSVLSYEAWRRLFGGESAAAAVGRTVTLNGAATIVVGVLPRGFSGVEPGWPIDIMAPVTVLAPIVEGRSNMLADVGRWAFQVLARKKPGMDDERVRTEVETLMRQALPPEFSTGDRPALRQIVLKDASQGLDSLRRNYAPQLYQLMTIMGAILVIACANIASLLIARGAARDREMGLRLALGAPRGRLVRQLLTESAVLAIIGGGGGVLLGLAAAGQLLPLLNQEDEPIVLTLGWSVWLGGFAIGLPLLVAAACGLLPAIRLSGVGPLSLLKRDVPGRMASPHLFAGKTLVVVQVTLSLVLLVGAALFLRTLVNLRSQAFGFRPDHLLLFQMDARANGYTGTRLTDFYEQVLECVANTPGVQSAAVSRYGLLSGGATTDSIRVPDLPAASGTPAPDRGLQVGVHIHRVSPNYFDTMGIRLLRGRDFTAADRERSPRVVVINEALARQLPADRSPVGRRLNYNDADWEVVGVATDARFSEIRDPAPATMYQPFRQTFLNEVTYAARTIGDPGRAAAPIREAVERFAPDVPMFRVRTQEEQIDMATREERLFAYAASGFAGLALLLACLGLYGTLDYSVARRSMEIGVRMALGADRGSVVRMVLRESMVPVVVGAACGLVAASLTTQVVQSQLFGLDANDPATMTAATLALLVSALVAAWIPCRRASGVDPMTALRRD